MPREFDFGKAIFKKLDADQELFKSARRYRRALLKRFADTLAEVLEEYDGAPLSYDNLIEIKVKTATRLSNLPRSRWGNCNDLVAAIKLHSAPTTYDKPQDAKSMLVDKELNEEARRLRAARFLSCRLLAEVHPRAYMLLTDMQL